MRAYLKPIVSFAVLAAIVGAFGLLMALIKWLDAHRELFWAVFGVVIFLWAWVGIHRTIFHP